MYDHAILSALDRLAEIILKCHEENMEKQGKLLDLLNRQIGVTELAAFDLALMNQTLTDCERHLHALADHFDPPDLD